MPPTHEPRSTHPPIDTHIHTPLHMHSLFVTSVFESNALVVIHQVLNLAPPSPPLLIPSNTVPNLPLGEPRKVRDAGLGGMRGELALAGEDVRLEDKGLEFGRWGRGGRGGGGLGGGGSSRGRRKVGDRETADGPEGDVGAKEGEEVVLGAL